MTTGLASIMIRLNSKSEHTDRMCFIRTPHCTYWLCSERRPGARCTASVLQRSDTDFRRGNNEHIHLSRVDLRTKTHVQANIRKLARDDVFRPAQSIVQEALTKHVDASQPMEAMPNLGTFVCTCLHNLFFACTRCNLVTVEI